MELMKTAGTYLRTMARHYPDIRLTQWFDYIRNLYLAGHI